MICPTDRSSLETIKIKGNTINACFLCGGVWFDYDELQATLKTFTAGEWESSYDFNKVNKNPINEETKRWRPAKELLCPRDSSLMREYIYAGDSHVHINECQTCGGFWFDGDELMQVWEYLKPNHAAEALGKAWIDLMEEGKREQEELQGLTSDIVMLAQQPTPMGLVLFLAQILRRHIAEKVREGKSGQF